MNGAAELTLDSPTKIPRRKYVEKFKYVGTIEKSVAEFQIWLHDILPYGKMKIKIYERQDHMFFGYTDIPGSSTV